MNLDAEGMQVCMTCGDLNPPDAPECQSCGADLPAGQAAPPKPAPEAAPDPGDAKCPYCNLPITPDAKECPHCRLNLDARDPINQPAPRGHENNLTARYEEFQSKVEGLRTTRISKGDFTIWLADVKGVLEAKREAYMEAVRQAGYYDMHPEEVEIAINAILDFEDSVNDMCDYALGETEVSALDAALAKMWDANERINEAMRMNRGFRAQLEDDWGYM